MRKKLFRPLLALLVFVLFTSLIIFIYPEFIDANPGVKIKGTVYYYNFEQGWFVNQNDSTFSKVTGGRYVPVKDTYVEVEFAEYTIKDVGTTTNDNGYYEVNVRNPILGKWNVNIEIEAKIKPGSESSYLIDCYEDSTDYFAYNFQTGSRSIGKNKTGTFDVYIGGPQNNIKEWYDADITGIWDEGAGDGKNHITAVFITQAINDMFDWATDRAAASSEISRKTCVIFPSDETGVFGYFSSNNNKYKPYALPPGVGHIHIIPRKLYPGQFDSGDRRYTIGHHWDRFRFILAHEYGHKIMHDVYWAWPSSLEDWNLFESSSHGSKSFNSPELAWLEGWAEFFAAAYMNKPGIPAGLASNDNIEITHDPGAINGVINIGAESYSISWVNTVLDSSNDGKRHRNEGTVAAVLWDIYDPTGWEYMSQRQQTAYKHNDWPSDIKWCDLLSDSNLEKIWTIISSSNPDCLLDEGDFYQDSFFYYWDRKYRYLEKYKINIHGLKAIMYNRGIETVAYSQHAPSIDNIEVDYINKKINLWITEMDKEDQPYLFFNIAYRSNDSEDYTILYTPYDWPVSGQGASWRGNTVNISVNLPDRMAASGDFIVMAHDNMTPVFKNYFKEISEDDNNNIEDEIEDNGRMLTLEEISYAKAKASFDVVVSDNYAYIADWEDDLIITDISDPYNPVTVSQYDQYSEKNSCDFYGGCSIALKDKYIYLGTNTGTLVVIDISDPYNPKKAGCFYNKKQLYDITIRGNYAYIADSLGLCIIDISDPTNPQMAGRVNTPNYAYSVAVAGNTAYIAGGGSVSSIDISNPKFPVIMCSFPRYRTKSVATNGSGIVYVGNLEGALYVIDFSDPSKPELLKAIKMKEPAWGMFIENNYLFMANPDAGMSVYDISVPDDPTEAFVYNKENPGGQERNVFVKNGYVYLTGGSVKIFKIINNE